MNEALKQLGEAYWEWKAAEYPTTALLRGDHRFDTEMEDASREAEDRRIAKLREFAAAARAVDPDTLDLQDQVTRGVLLHETESAAKVAEQRAEEFGVSYTHGSHIMFFNAAPQIPLTDPQHAEDLLVKYRKVGGYFDQLGERLRQGIAAGRFPMRRDVEESIKQIDGYLASPMEHDPFLAVNPPPQWNDNETAVWRDRLSDVIESALRPAYARYRTILHDELLGRARPDTRPGVSWVPGGDELYAAAITYHTTLDRTADEIHQIGIETVAALEDEYRAMGPPVLGTDDVGEMYRKLRDDPELHYEDGPTIIADCEAAFERARAEMPNWFGRMPEADCVVRETAIGPTAFYSRPADDGSRPGTFFVNTAVPERWGTFEVEAMAFHEGIPGHHLQIAIASELTDVPEFRKSAYVNAYSEGWGLYTERLADEMGLYGGPLHRIGMLSNDSMRACRLVVDTGMHAKGWTRDQAVEYMLAHSPMSLSTIEAEVDRYIAWPGQALGYMMGRREIVRIRREVEERMGPQFDIQGFHDTVLTSGPVPLPVLEDLVREWAAA